MSKIFKGISLFCAGIILIVAMLCAAAYWMIHSERLWENRIPYYLNSLESSVQIKSLDIGRHRLEWPFSLTFENTKVTVFANQKNF